MKNELILFQVRIAENIKIIDVIRLNTVAGIELEKIGIARINEIRPIDSITISDQAINKLSNLWLQAICSYNK